MLVVQDQVWGRVTANRNAGKATRYYMDEFHLLLKEEQTAAYSVEIWKRFRKWGGIPTGITQNVKDLLSSREVTNIFENSDFIYMLNQAAGDRQILADQLNISPHQLSYVTHSGEGEGLLFYGNVILPFVDRFPTDLELYRIMTTKLTEVKEGSKGGVSNGWQEKIRISETSCGRSARVRRTPFAIPGTKPPIAVRETATRKKSGTPKADSSRGRSCQDAQQEAEIGARGKGKEECSRFREKRAESLRSREILRQMHFQPKRIRVCAMPTRIIIPAWRQRFLPKVQRREQPARVPGSSMVESCGSTKSWSGWRKRQIKMP